MIQLLGQVAVVRPEVAVADPVPDVWHDTG
jgi:hypothetical protein